MYYYFPLPSHFTVDASNTKKNCHFFLGPLLYLIYITDFSTAVRCKLRLYADGSTLLFSGKNTQLIQESLSSVLEEPREWLFNVKLFLHPRKTESILFVNVTHL